MLVVAQTLKNGTAAGEDLCILIVLKRESVLVYIFSNLAFNISLPL